MKQKIAISILYFVLCLNIFSQEKDIVIPAVHIPAKHIPARYIPAVHIPEKTTSYGTIPAMDIPAIEIPAINISATDTISESFRLPDYAKIFRSSVIIYASLKPEIRQKEPLPKAYQLSRVDRDNAFIKFAPYATRKLLDLFAAADFDHSGTLSWDELSGFQVNIFHKFIYKLMAKAIRPDEFMNAGGGDCKDWSLFTAAFCKYWGWDAYIGAFFNKEEGHAICFVKARDEVPVEYVSWDLKGYQTVEGNNMPSGTYVPVDYDHVGSYSSALRAGMKLDYFMTPEEMYHRFG